MPIFEFRCRDCGKEFEEMYFPNLSSSRDDDVPKCPDCGSQRVVKLMSAGSFRPEGIAKGKGGFTPPKCRS